MVRLRIQLVPPEGITSYCDTIQIQEHDFGSADCADLLNETVTKLYNQWRKTETGRGNA